MLDETYGLLCEARRDGQLVISTKANRARLDLPGTQGVFTVSVGIRTSC